MMQRTVSKDQFDQIRNYLKQQECELLISDFNGVLDDYYVQKYDFLARLLDDDTRQYLAALAVFTDTEYIANQSATLEQSVKKFFNHHNIPFTPAAQGTVRSGANLSTITPMAKEFLEQLPCPYVIYTSQHSSAMQHALAGLAADIYSRDRTGHEKPSVQNLEMILDDYTIAATKACVIGDGLIDDLMPARLLGMKTILVSPFADAFHAT